MPSPIPVEGDYQLTSNSEVLADPLLVLHFILVSINPKGSPARIMSEIASGFLSETSFLYKEIIFDLTTNERTVRYTKEMTALVRSLEK